MTTEVQVKEKPAIEIIDISKMDEQSQTKAMTLAKSIDLTNTQAVVEYGVGPQTDIANFADKILSEVRSKDTGYVGEMLQGLVHNVKELDVDELGEEKHFWEKLPLISGLVDRAKRFIARYDDVSSQLEKLVAELETAQQNLTSDLTMLDGLHEQNAEYLKELDVHIAAGQLKVNELLNTTLPELEAAAKESGDPLDAQKYQDLQQFITRFEKKLHDLKLSRMISIQTQPQIRLIQNNNQLLVEKIQSSVLNTIPLWKNQIVVAISLLRQKKALEAQKEVSDTTNEMLKKNSEMLKQSSIETAKEGERGIVDIETLQKVNTDLITTIEETLRIQSEGKAKRKEAEKELVRLEDELKTKLLESRKP